MSWIPSAQWGMQNYGMNQVPQQPANTGMVGADPNAAASGFQLGWNAPTFQLGMQGLNTIGNIWGAWQSNKLAKDQLNFTKRIATANLNNQIASYNTALEDRARSRAAAEGQTSAEQQAYIDKNRLLGG